MEVSIFEVLFFLTLLVYTAPHIMVFGAVSAPLFFHSILRSTEEAVRGHQYGPHPSIQPEKSSFECCIHRFGPY